MMINAKEAIGNIRGEMMIIIMSTFQIMLGW